MLPSRTVSPQKRSLFPVLCAVEMYLACCALIYVNILRQTNGHFFFSLDDPYIHMALARQLLHGHYGLNPGEASSPSSSLLWPFLLTPLARFAAFPQLVLALNVLFGTVSAAIAGFAASRLPEAAQTRRNLALAIVAVVLIFTGNLVGLTFLGMEHVLQVALSGLCALGLIEAWRGRRIPGWAIAAALIAPWVRYECLGLTVAVALVLVLQERRRAAIALMAGTLAPLVAFSIFLHHLGLPWLPISVLIKAWIVPGQQSSALPKLFGSILLAVSEPEHLPLTLLTAAIAHAALREKVRERRLVLFAACVPLVLQILIGRFGWAWRYEVYAVFYAALLALTVWWEQLQASIFWCLLGLTACALQYVHATFVTAYNAADVYLQQYQTHRFLSDFGHWNFGVNDLGLVSLERQPGQYVFDFAGLGSPEFFYAPQRNAAWMQQMVVRHQLGLVAIYPESFGVIPADWTSLGEVCITHSTISVGSSCVTYYATPVASLPAASKAFADFIHTLPAEDVALPPGTPSLNRRRILE